MEGIVTISKNEYISLLIDRETLRRLESGGVDNWGHYEASLNPEGEPTMDNEEETIYDKVGGM